MKILKLAFVFVLLVSYSSCKKDNQTKVPYVYVYETLYPNTLDYINISGYKYLNSGYRGIIVYRMSTDEFRVYERCCPWDPENVNARVSVESNGLSVIDTVCKSRFSLIDGVVFQGPSHYPLVNYNYSYDGEKLLIFN
ncbi:MAG: hypothetical protein HXX13_10930 [Bacteroidetes bacterium]|nr:hypothetical protein [Bacteroidota bacterium]